jgi:chemotaxis protein methyltransferase CheR
MIDAVTTNKTNFFREPRHFDYLTEKVLPDLMNMHGSCSSRKLAVWSAGCATGEEPYTIAMVLSEFSETRRFLDFKILATDISTKALEKAVRAIYSQDGAETVPIALKRKYLMRSRDRRRGLVRIIPELRSKVRFRRLNFMEPDLGIQEPMDIIFCRNVIIYFDKPTQERLIRRLFEHLIPGGYLFMGHTETLSGLRVPSVSVGPMVYRKHQ